MDKHPGGNLNRSQPATGSPGAPARLHDLGISKSQSSRWQAIAAVLEHVFDRHLADVREQGRRDGTTELTSAGAILLARQYRPALRTLVPVTVPDQPDCRDQFEVADAAALPWPDGQIDLIVCSPPYGLGLLYQGGDPPDYVAWLRALQVWLTELLRVAHPDWGRLCLNVPLDRDLGGWQPVSADTIDVARSVGWQFRTGLLWDKGQAGAGPTAAASTPPAPPTSPRPSSRCSSSTAASGSVPVQRPCRTRRGWSCAARADCGDFQARPIRCVPHRFPSSYPNGASPCSVFLATSSPIRSSDAVPPQL